MKLADEVNETLANLTEEKAISPATLRAKVDATGSYFFTPSSMKFFGDTMRNYGVRHAKVRPSMTPDKEVEAWELYRRNPVSRRFRDGTMSPSLSNSSYFDKTTFERIHPHNTRELT